MHLSDPSLEIQAGAEHARRFFSATEIDRMGWGLGSIPHGACQSLRREALLGNHRGKTKLLQAPGSFHLLGLTTLREGNQNRPAARAKNVANGVVACL